MTDRHLCSPDEIRNDPCYTQFLAKHGLGWVAAIAVSPEPHVGVIVSIQRDSRRKSEFSDDELGLLVVVGRHIEKSLRLSIRLLDAELTRLGLGEALARIGIGVFSLDSLGRVVFSNPAGRRLVGDDLHLVQDRLCIGSGSTREAIDKAISHALRGYRHDLVAEPKPLLVHSLNSNRRLVIYLLPIGARTSLAEEFLTNTRAIVLVIEQKLDEPPDPTLVRDVLRPHLGRSPHRRTCGLRPATQEGGRATWDSGRYSAEFAQARIC
jgi:hypothetical protein